LALQDAATHIPVAWAPRRRALERVALGLALLLGLVFALRAVERAALWRSAALLTVDAARHYPQGKAACVLRAQRAVQLGDVDGVVSALRQAAERGYNRYDQLETDPAWAPVRNAPEFRALVRELAAGWIERLERKPNPTQGELRGVAHAHIARGEIRAALVELERALAAGGPFDDDIRMELQALRSAVESGREDSIRLSTGVNDR